MANKKITELDAATSLASTDVLVAVDVSEDVTKKTTVNDLFRTLPDGNAAAPSLSFASDAGNGVFLAGTDTVGISTGGTQRVTVDGSGNVTISGDLQVDGATTTVQSTTVTIDDKNIELGSVASPSNTTADGGGITLKASSDKTIKWINSTGYWTFNTGIEVGGHLQIDDSNEIRVGTGQDLKIFHASGENFIRGNASASPLYIDCCENLNVRHLDTDGGNAETMIKAVGDGAVELYNNGAKKFETKSDGIDVTGEVQCDSLDVDGGADISGSLTVDSGTFHVDSTNNRVGVGTTSMYQPFEVKFTDSATSFGGTGAGGDWGAGSRGMLLENESTVVGAKALVQYRVGDADYFAGIQRVGSNSGSFIFQRENNSPDVTFTSGGLVYAGTTTADGSAHVFATSAPSSYAFKIHNTNSNNSVATLGLKIKYDVSPNDTNNAIELQVGNGSPFVVRNNGNVQNTNGSFTNFSDARYKENIVDASSQWEDIKNTRIRKWNFKPELGWATHTMLGPVAQELELVSPGLVIDNPVLDDDNNPTGEVQKSVNQSILYMKAVKALQEAMARIEELEAKVAALEAS